MKFPKLQVLFIIGFTLVSVFISCSKDDPNSILPPEPVDPPTPITTVPLTQFEVILGDQTTSGNGSVHSSNVDELKLDEFNHPKTTFIATNYFTFSYNNVTESSQKAYAYTNDGKTWTVHEKEDANSPVKTIQLDINSPALNATYLPIAAIQAGADKDGIMTLMSNALLVNCFDALHATAEVTVSNNKATAKIPFKHINHLLNFYIRGTINENSINRLELDITYIDAAGHSQTGILSTSSRSSYADTDGKMHTVIQAIVPRNAVVKGLRAVKRNNSPVTTPDVVNIDCPGGKSHLITLNINDDVFSLQVGTLIDNWAFSGEMNTDGSPIGDIYISTADELRGFSEAVNANPNKPAAKINGVLAYTAHVVQTADIDLSSLAWRPIGGNSYDNDGDIEVAYFAGTYNGNGYKISGMKVTSSTASGHSIASYGGMFGNVQSPAEGYTILTNIQLVDVNIRLQGSIDYSNAGALVGLVYAPSGKKPIVISQCTVQGTVEVINNSGQVAVGGLVGDAIRAHITGCSTDVSVTANASGYSQAGGIAGHALDTSIASSYATNSVTGNSSNGTSVAGGIAGYVNSQQVFSYLLACSSNGEISSNGKEANAGGIVGHNTGNVTGCYARGNPTSTNKNAKLGAIVASGASDIRLCYGVGAIGVGTSNAVALPHNIVYQSNPVAGNILSIVSGQSWKDTYGKEMAEATVGGILTTIPIYAGGKWMQKVKSRLWILSDMNVWTLSSPANNIYPLPAKNYKGE